MVETEIFLPPRPSTSLKEHNFTDENCSTQSSVKKATMKRRQPPPKVKKTRDDEASNSDSDAETNHMSLTRMKLRSKMLRFGDKVELAQRNAENGNVSAKEVNKCVRRYTKADILHKANKPIINGRDLAVDSHIGDKLSCLLITNVGQLSSNAKNFDMINFAKALAPEMDHYYEANLTSVFDVHSPCLSGPLFDLEAVPKPKKDKVAERKTVKRSAKGALITVEGKQTNELDDDRDQSLLVHLSKVKKAFLTYLKTNNTDHINYYSLVIDPTSYVNTIENCFYVSFLIKDNVFFLERKNHESPPILRALTEREKSAKSTLDQRKKNQCVNTMSYAKYAFLKTRFNVTTRILPAASLS